MKSSFHRLIPFLAVVLRLKIPKTWLNSIPLLPGPYYVRLASGKSTLHSTALLQCRLYNCFARTTQKTQHLYCWECVFTAPLHSNGNYLIAAFVLVTEYVTESLPSDKRLFWLHYSGFQAFSCMSFFSFNVASWDWNWFSISLAGPIFDSFGKSFMVHWSCGSQGKHWPRICLHNFLEISYFEDKGRTSLSNDRIFKSDNVASYPRIHFVVDLRPMTGRTYDHKIINKWIHLQS
jgi:hypothetical protein